MPYEAPLTRGTRKAVKPRKPQPMFFVVWGIRFGFRVHGTSGFLGVGLAFELQFCERKLGFQGRASGRLPTNSGP